MTTAQTTATTPKSRMNRFYGYTNNANAKYIEKGAKVFGSKAKFLDALVTTARKSKLVIAAPRNTKTKTSRRVLQ